MRFLTSKTSLFIISFIFIFILFWMNIGNLNFSAHFTDKQGSNSQQDLFLKKLGDLISGFFKWVYEFSLPFAAEAGKSFQTWWDTQKAVIMHSAVQWLVDQQNNLSSNLQSLLLSIISDGFTPK